MQQVYILQLKNLEAKCWKSKISTKKSTLGKLSFKNEGQIKTFLNKQAEEFVTTMPALQKMIKQAHQVEIKR